MLFLTTHGIIVDGSVGANDGLLADRLPSRLRPSGSQGLEDKSAVLPAVSQGKLMKSAVIPENRVIR